MAYKPQVLEEAAGGTGTTVPGKNMIYKNLERDGTSDLSSLTFTNGKMTSFTGFVQKVFDFTADTETWTATAGDARVEMAWKKPRSRSSHPANVLGAQLGGSLRTTAKNNAGASENYWEILASWEDMGVPVGATVTSVASRYLYRFMGRAGLGGRNQGPNTGTSNNEAVFTATELGSGPFELRQSDDTLVGTFSKRIFAPARTLIDLWHYKPQDPAQPYTPFSATPFAISAYPPSWGRSQSAIITVPGGLQPSSTMVKLRLNSGLPATAALTGSTPAYWVRLTQDRVEVVINYFI